VTPSHRTNSSSGDLYGSRGTFGGSRSLIMDFEKVAKATRLLTDDYHRQSNHLYFQDFARTVAKRKLTGAEADAVRAQLSGFGIEIASPPERPRNSGVELSTGNLLTLFIRDMKRYRLLSHSDEIALGQAIASHREQVERCPESVSRDIAAAGDQARQEFALANLRLVVSTAKEYRWSGIDLLDLVTEGCSHFTLCCLLVFT
jgi:DNA-directed RNA polymerase sigma subunit (sigma70/sigma32)